MKKLTYQEVKEYIESFGYELLSKEYINNATDLDVKCDKGHEYKVKFRNFRAGKRCPYCNGGVSKWTKEAIENYVKNNGYIFVDYIKFNKYSSRILIQCNNGHEPYEVLFGNFYRGKRCEKCNRSKWQKEDIIKYVENEDYDFIEFINFDKGASKIKVRCTKGHEYEVVFKKFQEGRRCPKCNESKGEREIKKVLEKYNIIYKREYKFKDCKLKKCLPFDFYLPDINVAIEFDGSQHYYISERFGGLDKFIETKIHDTIKNEYCKKNNIKLIRIPYWKFDNIENIIVNELNLK